MIKKDGDYQHINDDVWNDLNMDNVFEFIDKTRSPIGKQYLYNTLRQLTTKSEIACNETFISHYISEDICLPKINKQIDRLKYADEHDIHSLITSEYKPFTKRTVALFRIMQFIPALCVILLFLNSASAFFTILLFVSFIANLIVHFRTKSLSFVNCSAVPQLAKLLSVAQNLSRMQDISENIRVPYNIQHDLSKLSALRQKLRNFQFGVKLETDITMLSWLVLELLKAFFLSETLNLHIVFKLIAKNREVLTHVYDYVGLIDTLGSVAKMRTESVYFCIPHQVQAVHDMRFEEIYHPLIVDCVPNTIEFGKQSFLFMGSNMSGKTSFIRSIGINTLLGLTLNTCFAGKAEICRLSIYSSIAINDDIMESSSYYLNEVKRLKVIIDNTQLGESLILLDELFKGTSTQERIACANAALKYLVQNPRNRVFVATHDFELAKLLQDYYKAYYFSGTIANKQLSFDFKLKTEKGNSNAIDILKIYDFPNQLVSEALDYVKNN